MFVPEDDKKILELLASNSNEAFEYLYNLYYARLVVFADRFDLPRETSEDLAQEVFIFLLRVRENFRTISQLKAYLYQSMRNRCLNHIRHTQVHDRYVESERLKTEHAFENAVIEEEIYARLIQAIEMLPPQSREVMRLSLQKKNNREIAELMGLAVETVKSYKKESKKKLIDYFMRTETLEMAILMMTVIDSL